MRTTTILTILVLALGLVLWQAEVSKAEPMGTAWTYQGRLMDANSAADGLYDFTFKLYDAEVGGNKSANDVNVGDLDVIDGYFTAELDFGSDAFNGDGRWLEIDVRPGNSNDGNDFVTLIPRHEVTVVPYALQTRGIFVDNVGNVGIGTTSPSGLLEVMTGESHGGPAVLDQSQTSGEYYAPNSKDCWQSFTAGIGGQLARVDMHFSTVSCGSEILRIYSGEGTGGSLLYTATISAPKNTWVSHTPTTTIVVTQGTKYTIRLTTSTCNGTNWGIAINNPYSGGRGNLSPGDDFEFRTYVCKDLPELLISSNGNVGIGTTDPCTAKLAVMGGNVGIGTTDPSTAKLAVMGGNVGIGTTSPSVPLEVAGNAKFNESVILGDAASDNLEINAYVSKDLNLIQWTKPNLNLGSDAINAGNIVVNDAGVARFEVIGSTGDVTISGNVGIGTISPSHLLDVDGSLRLRQSGGGNPGASLIELGNRSGSRTYGINFNAYYDGSWKYRSSDEAASIGFEDDGDLVFFTMPSGPADFPLIFAPRITIKNSGNVGIGTSGPAYRLDVAGPAHATSFPVSSDARFKANVKQLTNVLERLEKIRGVSFEWNELYESLGRSTGHTEIGVIAQEVEGVFPELVTKWGDEKYRAVDYSRLTGVLIEAIKQLKAKNEALEQRLRALERTMQQLAKAKEVQL